MRKTSDERAYIHGKLMSFSDLFFEYCKIEDENEKLKAENKELKDKNEILDIQVQGLFNTNMKLDDEVRKLRNANKKENMKLGIINDPIKENEEYFEIKMYKYKRKYEICKKKLELIMLHLEEVKEVLNEKDC